MTDTIIYALIVGGITSLHIPAFGEKDQTKLKAARWLWAKKFALFTFLAALLHYVLISAGSQSHWFSGTYTIVTVLLFLNLLMDGGDVPLIAQMTMMVAVLFASCTATVTDASAEKASRIGPVERVNWSKTPPPLRLQDIPLVRQEQAVARGVKVVREKYSSRYGLGSFTLQKVNGTPVWVAPLALKSFGQSSSDDYPPGCIIVDAENPSAAVRVVSRDSHNAPVRIVYAPKGFFGHNLIRHINSVKGVLSFACKDVHLEVDDNLKPWWVVSGYRALGERNFKERGSVLLVDPESGAVSSYTPDTIPAWVDVAFSSKDVAEKLKDWGTLSSGWGAKFMGSPYLTIPSIVDGESVWIVHGSDGRSYHYAGMKQHNIRYDRLNSFALTDTRSGETTEYPLDSSSGVTPRTAFEMVSRKLSSFQGLSATTPLVCSIDAHPVYVFSIVDENNVFKKIALVDAQSDIIVLGEDKDSALREFQRLVKRPSATSS